MSARLTAVTALRVINQLRRDARTMVMLLAIPGLLMVLLRYVFDASPELFDRIGVALLAIFPFITMFLVTSVAMLRERSSGTLERLLTTPISKLDLLLGYGVAFGIIATLQTSLTCLVAFGLLGLDITGSIGLIVLIAVADAGLGMALGLLVSAFATSEFQAVQFMPAVVFPQLLLCGLFTPREAMIGWLEVASNVMPLSYAVEALNEIARNTAVTGLFWRDLSLVAVLIVVSLGLAAATLRRRTP
ncbi:MAG: ABC transporter permease [Mycobacteriales bacterium]